MMTSPDRIPGPSLASPSISPPSNNAATTTTTNAAITNANGGGGGYRNRPHLTVDVSADAAEVDHRAHDVKTPPGVRGHADLRSPGAKKTPLNAELVARTAGASAGAEGAGAGSAGAADDPALPAARNGVAASVAGTPAAGPPPAVGGVDGAGGATGPTAGGGGEDQPPAPIPDFIAQTDRHGNATTPRSGLVSPSLPPRPRTPAADGKAGALTDAEKAAHADGETQKLVGDDGKGGKGEEAVTANGGDDACDTLLDSFRMMCCCLLPEDGAQVGTAAGAGAGASGGTLKDGRSSPNNHDGGGGTAPPTPNSAAPDHPVGYSTRGHDAPLLLEEHSALHNGNDPHRIRLLPPLHEDDRGKKCLVLDLDETLVHSSFRAVPGADFVIPVQIEDVVHFVYVAKRPGVDEFLVEMARHYEIIVYTASLNKYADVLLDLLDPKRVIRTRLFRESCVFYEGNYVKDLSLLNRDLSQCVIIDNSPASYLFHPENAIDCTSFIDDPNDRELDHIGKFLAGVKDVADLRGTVNLWRHWPNVDLTENRRRIQR